MKKQFKGLIMLRKTMLVLSGVLLTGCQWLGDGKVLDPNAPVEVLSFSMEEDGGTKLIDGSPFHNDATALQLPYDDSIKRPNRTGGGKALLIDTENILFGPLWHGTFIPRSESLQPEKFKIEFDIKPLENEKFRRYRILSGQIHPVHKKVKDANLTSPSYRNIPIFLVTLLDGNILKLSFYLKNGDKIEKKEFVAKKALPGKKFSQVKWLFDGKKVQLKVNGEILQSWDAPGKIVYDHPDYNPGHLVYKFASGGVKVEDGEIRGVKVELDNFKMFDLAMKDKAVPLAIKIGTNHDLNFFAQDEDKEFKVGISNFTTKEIEGLLKYRVTDHTGAEVHRGEVNMELVPRRETVTELEIPSEKRGCFWLNCEFEAESGRRAETETQYAVGAIRDVSSFPASSPFGVDTAEPSWGRMTCPDLGMKWVRLWLGWHHMEKKEGERNWTPYDRAVNYHHRQGQKTMICLFGTPTWAVSDELKKLIKEGKEKRRNAHYHPAADMNKRKEFLRAFISRYADKVDAWEIWNEVDLGYWRGTAEEYMKLAKVTKAIVKELDPTAEIIGPSFAGSANNPFGRKLMSMGLLDILDGLAIHYMGGWRRVAPETVIGKIDSTNDLMEKYGEVIPIWNGEFGYFTPTRNPITNRPYTPEELEKRKKNKEPLLCVVRSGNDCCEDEITTSGGYVRTLLLAMSLGVPKNFRHGLGKMKYESELYRGVGRKGTGVLLTAIAWTTMVERFSNAKFVKRLELGNDKLFALLFKDLKNDKNILACWRSEGYEDVLLDTASEQVEFFDLWGNPALLKAMAPREYKLRFSKSPFYLHGVGDGAGEAKSFFSATAPKLVERGKKATLDIAVKNPLAKQLEASFDLKPSSGLELSQNKLKFTLAPGEKKTRKIEISATPSFSGNNASISVTFNSKQTGEITRFLTFPVSSPPTKCAYRQGEIKIDGEANETAWKNGTAINMKDVNQVAVGRPPFYEDATTIKKDKEWYGPDDLSAEGRLLWDEKNLYLMLKVKDDKSLVIDREKRPFKGDCIELFLDGRKGPKLGKKAYSKGVAHLILVPGDEKHPKASFLIAKSDEESRKCRIEVASKPLKDGYLIEAKIPIDQNLFPKFKMKQGAILGFDIAIDDADLEKRKSQIVWKGGKENYRDASQFGKLILKK